MSTIITKTFSNNLIQTLLFSIYKIVYGISRLCSTKVYWAKPLVSVSFCAA